jgi:hypothetical protein
MSSKPNADHCQPFVCLMDGGMATPAVRVAIWQVATGSRHNRLLKNSIFILKSTVHTMHQIFSMTIFSIDYRKDRAETDSCTVISP